MNTQAEKNQAASRSHKASRAERVPTFGSIGIPAVAAAAAIAKGAPPREVDAQRNRSNGRTASRFAN
ncbi:hypothetical protein [Chelatococcus asaccharovorans]|uniref:Uncharacterized protein n=1 Tax=Chelatococcus asaccharovorans TaxID=28210 RepID=A0A2V3U1X9_9HYPH|nr:hypothetical protein [Chelatococcus asaccharovorans]MBS7702383.1 hypothetical protein [Chelatococcus asaccharovorans]PXW56415.1 hypothetical protein C7450_108165 [Chelatococcus asaccharovorans]